MVLFIKYINLNVVFKYQYKLVSGWKHDFMKSDQVPINNWSNFRPETSLSNLFGIVFWQNIYQLFGISNNIYQYKNPI